MSRRPRRKDTPAFKAKVALAALKNEKTLAELSQEFDDWKNQLLANAVNTFGGNGQTGVEVDVKTLHAKIGQLTLENDF